MPTMHPAVAAEISHRTRLWNALIPRRACRVEPGRTHVRYLHPTKGWRRVANARLGLPVGA